MTDEYKALEERLRDVRRHGFGWPDLLQADDLMDEAADAIKALTMHLGDVVAIARSARNPANYQRVGPTIDDYARALDKIADTDARSEWIARVCDDAERYKAALEKVCQAVPFEDEVWTRGKVDAGFIEYARKALQEDE